MFVQWAGGGGEGVMGGKGRAGRALVGRGTSDRGRVRKEGRGRVTSGRSRQRIDTRGDGQAHGRAWYERERARDGHSRSRICQRGNGDGHACSEVRGITSVQERSPCGTARAECGTRAERGRPRALVEGDSIGEGE